MSDVTDGLRVTAIVARSSKTAVRVCGMSGADQRQHNAKCLQDRTYQEYLEGCLGEAFVHFAALLCPRP